MNNRSPWRTLYLLALLLAAIATVIWTQVRLRALSNENEQVHSALRELDPRLSELSNRLEQLTAEEQVLANRVALAHQRASETPTAEKDESVSQWLESVDKLKTYLAGNTHLQIPDFELLTAEDWLAATQGIDLQTEADYRHVAAELRVLAKRKTITHINDGLKRYLEVSGGKHPPSVHDVAPYINDELARQAFIDRWENKPEDWDGMRVVGATIVFSEKQGFYDDTWYSHFHVTDKGSYGWQTEYLALEARLSSVLDKFYQENSSQPTTLEQLAPYLSEEDKKPKNWARYQNIFHATTQPPSGL